jgi:hypothetical protein
MPFRWLAAAFTLLFPLGLEAAELAPSENPRNESVLRTWNQVAVEPTQLRLTVGDRAPGFSYLDINGQWQSFTELSSGVPMLLVFGANSADLAAIEEMRVVFQDLGVVPVAVMDGRAAAVRALLRKGAFSGPIITDPKRAIAGLYNSVDPGSLTNAPGFFVLDEGRKIRALGRGSLPPPMSLVTLSARTLGRPLPKSALSRMNS